MRSVVINSSHHQYTILTCLTCPICEGTLERVGSVLKCPRGHSFDVAREGYVNLLTGKPRGDTREMARARRAFLEQGWYAPLSDRLNALAAQCLAITSTPLVLDAGCGEGYYLGRLAGDTDARGAEGPAHEAEGLKGEGAQDGGRVYLGLDISKDAVRLAARRYSGIGFVVADLTRRLPIATAAVGLLLNVFAPRNAAEFERVLAPGGALLIAIPAPEHLMELRGALSLLAIEPEKERHVITQLAGAFELVSAETVAYPMRLDRMAAGALVTMTPNYWHRTERTADALAALGDETAATAAFRVLRFRRR